MERARTREVAQVPLGSELARGLRYHLGTLCQAGVVLLVALTFAALLAGWRVHLPDPDDATGGVSRSSLAVSAPFDAGSVRPDLVVHVRHGGFRRVEEVVPTLDGDVLLRTPEGTVPASLVDGELRWSVPGLGPLVRAALTPLGASLVLAAAVAVASHRERRRWRQHLDAVALLEALRDGELRMAFEHFEAADF